MRKSKFRVTDPSEAGFLGQVEVRLVMPTELARCEQEVCENHYLENAHLVGEQLWYVAEYQGQWLALLGWSAAAYHLKGRESWIGWNDTQRRARLSLVANNARFCLLTPAGKYPNLASYVMGQCLGRLSEDWQQSYGHPILVVESFVDTQLFRGSCYKATGWRAIGCTAGFKRVAQDFYQVHERPKQLFVLEVAKHGARTLRARRLPEALAEYERKVDPQLEFQQALWAWQKARLGSADGGEVVLDGKALRGSQGTQLVGAINARSGRALGVEAVADKSNEIPAGQTLLDRLDLDGTIALMDALHTQVQTAGTVVQERGGDFVLVVKGNQKTLLGQAQTLLPEDFSPSTDDPRRRPRTHRVARDKSAGSHATTNGLSSCPSARTGGPHS